MQQQYKRFKDEHPDKLLMFRMGDFYESFDDDAKLLAKTLGITLTSRGKGKDGERTPMAGIPHHALENYMPKIVKAGIKAVIVEQTGAPEAGKLVEREITQILSPGTLTQDNTLAQNLNNYIMAVHASPAKNGHTYGVAIADISTGALQVFETPSPKTLAAELNRFAPAEILVADTLAGIISPLYEGYYTKLSDIDLDKTTTAEHLTAHFGTANLKGFGIESLGVAQIALGALLNYIENNQREKLSHLNSVSLYNVADYMVLDQSTIRNLELVYSQHADSTGTTILENIDNCATNMGKRKLYTWLLRPLLDPEKLQERWDSVEFFYSDDIFANKVADMLGEVFDIERIVSRLGVGKANARDLIYLKDSLIRVLELGGIFSGSSQPSRIQSIIYNLEQADSIPKVIELVTKTLKEDPPATITEGGLIAPGFSQEIDELRELAKGGKSTLAEIQSREAQETGISTLKVGFNKVFGYYIEVSQSQSTKVPPHYIRKQTLANGERYITEELKELETRILNAEERLLQLEFELFSELRNQLIQFTTELLFIADLIAELDIYVGLGRLAKQKQFTKPQLSSQVRLKITEGRHPVVEALQADFTPNDVEFGKNDNMIILTGPNMSGKSTYIRQVAIVALLAQIGSFVPAAQLEFQIIDRIFTRVGAADNLARGESTFMVEMNETANILNNATERSLIILDEVGRGTSTYDGVAIAWAISEHLITETKAMTLFATHYHELIELEQKYPGIKNYHVQVKESQNTILFQHKIAEGSTSKSYGVHVAEMAGVPTTVTKRAKEILDSFEGNAKSPTDPLAGELHPKQPSPKRPARIAPEQIGLLD